jgi:hypothetical protein
MYEATIYSLLNTSKLYVNFPDGGKWTRQFLKVHLGDHIQMEWERDSRDTVWWTVAKTHREKLTEALQGRYQGVWVIRDHRVNQACTGSCRAAKTQDCECSCGGQFHGGTTDLGNVAADFLVDSAVRRVARYYAGHPKP